MGCEQVDDRDGLIQYFCDFRTCILEVITNDQIDLAQFEYDLNKDGICTHLVRPAF